MLDYQSIETESTLVAISSRSSWNFHVEETIRYELSSVLDAGELDHLDQLLSCAVSLVIW